VDVWSSRCDFRDVTRGLVGKYCGNWEMFVYFEIEEMRFPHLIVPRLGLPNHGWLLRYPFQ
jgi:hypothetical protein